MKEHQVNVLQSTPKSKLTCDCFLIPFKTPGSGGDGDLGAMERAPLHLLHLHHGLSLFSSSDTRSVWTHTQFWTKQ